MIGRQVLTGHVASAEYSGIKFLFFEQRQRSCCSEQVKFACVCVCVRSVVHEDKGACVCVCVCVCVCALLASLSATWVSV